MARFYNKIMIDYYYNQNNNMYYNILLHNKIYNKL